MQQTAAGIPGDPWVSWDRGDTPTPMAITPLVTASTFGTGRRIPSEAPPPSTALIITRGWGDPNSGASFDKAALPLGRGQHLSLAATVPGRRPARTLQPIVVYSVRSMRRRRWREVESISRHTNQLRSMFVSPERRNIVHLPNLPLKSRMHVGALPHSVHACKEGAAMEVLCIGV